MSLDNPKYQDTITKASIGGWIVFFIAIVISTTWYTTRTSDHITNNQQSKDKITAIDEAFQSALGTKWPYVLLVFTIVLALCLFFLYLASKKEVITVNLSDKASHTFNIVFMIFVIVFSILVIVLAVKEWLNYRKKQDSGDSPNYEPTVQQDKKNKQIMAIVGLSLLVLASLGFGVWYMFKRKGNLINRKK